MSFPAETLRLRETDKEAMATSPLRSSAPPLDKTPWPIKPLGDLCDILDSQRKPITKRDRTAGEFPYYGATGIQDYVAGFIFDEPLVLVGEDGAKWASGDNTAFAVSGKCWVNNHAHVLRPHRQAILDNWLIYFLNHSDLSEFVSGLTVPKLNQGNLREIPIPVPPLTEQERIVGILDEAFDGIGKAKATAEANLQNARALFQSHLQSVFSQQGDGWVEKKLEEICTFENGDRGENYPSKAARTESGIPFINAGHLTDDGVDMESMDFISKERFDLLSNGKICPDDILFCLRGSLGKFASVGDLNEGAIASSLVIVRPGKSIRPEFILAYFQSSLCAEMISLYKNGAAQPNLSSRSLRNFIIPIPPSEDEGAIVQSISAIRTETQRLESLYQNKLNALDELKKSLLHQAFTGNL
jgi:type I restriction enzyme S subunit